MPSHALECGCAATALIEKAAASLHALQNAYSPQKTPFSNISPPTGVYISAGDTIFPAEIILFHADVILDLLCRRQPYYSSAASLFTLADNGTVQLFSSPVIMANIFYILRKIMGIAKAQEALRKIRILVKITPVDEKIVDLALNSNLQRF